MLRAAPLTMASGGLPYGNEHGTGTPAAAQCGLLEVLDRADHLESGQLDLAVRAAAVGLSAHWLGTQPGHHDGGGDRAVSVLRAALGRLDRPRKPQAHDDRRGCRPRAGDRLDPGGLLAGHSLAGLDLRGRLRAHYTDDLL